MKINKISFNEFEEKTKEKEGIVVLGAGGNPQDWINGIVTEWKKEEIAKTKDPKKCFSKIYQMTSTGGRTDLAMVFKADSGLNIGRMAMWRLEFGDCSWISDFKDNYRSHYE